MNIDSIHLPPVSKKFYDTLIRTFPPLNALDIKEDTTLISIHRDAARQEVIEFVRRAVRETEEVPTINITLLDRVKYVLFNK